MYNMYDILIKFCHFMIIYNVAKAGAYRPPALRGKPYTYKLVGYTLILLLCINFRSCYTMYMYMSHLRG